MHQIAAHVVAEETIVCRVFSPPRRLALLGARRTRRRSTRLTTALSLSQGRNRSEGGQLLFDSIVWDDPRVRRQYWAALKRGIPGNSTEDCRLSIVCGQAGLLANLQSTFPGGHRRGVTPVPIPNTEVKPSTADGTAWATAWESRSLPGLFC